MDGWADDCIGGRMNVSAGIQVNGLRKMGYSPETTSQDSPESTQKPPGGPEDVR